MRLKKISISIFLILFLSLLANFSFSQGDLEVPLPQIGGTPAIEKTPILSDYVKYIFNLAVGITGLVAFAVLVYGGVRYLTSGGNPSTMADANNQMISAGLGLLVILGSYLLLTTINPQLVVIKGTRGATPATTTTSGVFLCKTATGDIATDCDGPYLSDKNSLTSDFDNKTNYVRFNNPEGDTYGVVLHEDTYLGGECEVIVSTGNQVIPMSKLQNRASSISVFRHGSQSSGEGVTLYECKYYDITSTVGPLWDRHTCGAIGPYRSEIEIDDINTQKPNFDSEVSSIKIEGKYIVILYKDFYLGGECGIFKQDEPTLSEETFDNNIKSFKILFGE